MNNNDHHNDGRDDPHEAPLDAANQSLADALRASFRILKYIMVLLVVLYLFSGVTFVQPNEQAVVARLGTILPKVHDPGMLWAWPFPIDDVIKLPVKEASELQLESHMIHLTEEEKNRGLRFVSRGHGSGLDPALDGALLTADKGLVHVRWVVNYKIDNLADYIRNLKGRDRAAAEELLRVLLESAAIHVAVGLNAEDVYRKQVDYVRTEVKRRINRDLAALQSGIVVNDVRVPVSIVPFQVRDVFEEAQKAENRRRRLIQDANKERTKILNDAAGASYVKLIRLLDEIDAAKLAQNAETLEGKQAQLAYLLDKEVAGEAGSRIKEAIGRAATVVGRIENDVSIYESLLPEYERNPRLLLARKWDETRSLILNNPQIVKIFRPFGLHQIRITIGPDPEHERQREIEQYREQEGLSPSREHMVPYGIP